MDGASPSRPYAANEDRSEEHVCRICRCGELDGEELGPLFSPCACIGSMKYVHQRCLVQWLRHLRRSAAPGGDGEDEIVNNAERMNVISGLGSERCEICNTAFRFTAIYKEETPERLPAVDLLRGIASRLNSHLFFAMRCCLCALVWLVLIPLYSLWLWRVSFSRLESIRLYESVKQTFFMYFYPQLLAHPQDRGVPASVSVSAATRASDAAVYPQLNGTVFLVDCMLGIVLCAFIIFLFIGATLLRDYLNQLYQQSLLQRQHIIQGERSRGGRRRRRTRPWARPCG